MEIPQFLGEPGVFGCRPATLSQLCMTVVWSRPPKKTPICRNEYPAWRATYIATCRGQATCRTRDGPRNAFTGTWNRLATRAVEPLQGRLVVRRLRHFGRHDR